MSRRDEMMKGLFFLLIASILALWWLYERASGLGSALAFAAFLSALAGTHWAVHAAR